jgi:chemotaxis protein MotB
MWSRLDGTAPPVTAWDETSGRGLLVGEVVRLRRSRGRAWILFASAGVVAAVLVASGLEQRRDLREQIETLNYERDTMDGQRRELSRHLASARALLEVKDQATAALLRGSSLTGAQTQALTRELATRAHQAELAVDAEGVRVVLPAAALFGGGGAELSPAGGRLLDQVGAAIRKLRGVEITVAAHTDSHPATARFESNWELSAARAVNVARHLTEECGLDPARVAATAHAQFRPRDGVAAHNRRVEIVLARAR